jgi:hypothetical protein
MCLCGSHVEAAEKPVGRYCIEERGQTRKQTVNELRCVPGCRDTVSRDRFALRTLAVSCQRVCRFLVDIQYSIAISILGQLPPAKGVAMFVMVSIVSPMSTIDSLAINPCVFATWSVSLDLGQLQRKLSSKRLYIHALKTTKTHVRAGRELR